MLPVWALSMAPICREGQPGRGTALLLPYGEPNKRQNQYDHDLPVPGRVAERHHGQSQRQLTRYSKPIESNPIEKASGQCKANTMGLRG